MIFVILFGIHIVSVFACFVICWRQLKKYNGRVTVEDVLKDTEPFMYVPIVNTVSLVIVGIGYCIIEVFGVGKLCKYIWNKIKDIEL